MKVDLDPNYLWELWDGSKWVPVAADHDTELDMSIQYRLVAKVPRVVEALPKRATE